MKNKYDYFIEQFANNLNNIANEALKSLSNIGIEKTKEELLKDIYEELHNQINNPKKEPEKRYDILPTTDLNELPELSKENLKEYISTFNRWTPLIIVEIVRIYIDEGYYAVEVRTMSSNFITKRFTEQEFIEVINQPKKEEQENVFPKEKRYSLTIK